MSASNIFLNVPFDREYEPLYVAQIAALTAFGSTPRSVLEIPPHHGRLERLRTIIGDCEASVHDLSRVELRGTPRLPRFNMPFELGLTLGSHRNNHKWIIFDSKPHRVSRSLSDLGGYDPAIHEGTAEGVLRAVTNAFRAKRRTVRYADLITLWNALRDVVPRVKKEQTSLFTRVAFEDLVVTGQKFARAHFSRV
jgi:hypothetical protein